VQFEFAKYEGLGNDFILTEWSGLTSEIARELCDRHLGVGADGVLQVTVSDGHAGMTVWNADGTLAEQCGNGLRCVALHLYRTGAMGSMEFDVHTAAGPKRCFVEQKGASLPVLLAVKTGDRASAAPAPPDGHALDGGGYPWYPFAPEGGKPMLLEWSRKLALKPGEKTVFKATLGPMRGK
jgi:diaminopimelate epimerase